MSDHGLSDPKRAAQECSAEHNSHHIAITSTAKPR